MRMVKALSRSRSICRLELFFLGSTRGIQYTGFPSDLLSLPRLLHECGPQLLEVGIHSVDAALQSSINKLLAEDGGLPSGLRFPVTVK
jgi:hypothetical protein